MVIIVEVIGISGSPTINANTDRLILEILDSTGIDSEFIKLSEIDIGPCTACMECVPTNECPIEDDFR